MDNESAIAYQKDWISKGHKPFLIAGPCSAETKEQVIETALRLKKMQKVDVLRAGIWKPRTRPDSFEGVGEIGLAWLREAKAQTGFPLTVEVAKSEHVEACLKHEIDMLWIGARTTVNPFAVQEIADSLKGVDVPVFIKNPINADLALWLGGVERISRAGIKNIAGIHRGFSNLAEKYYRNRPQWQIALAFKSELPEIPLICDPSHICGRRDILLEVSQKAMDLNYDGLMIESHIDPDNAWSDAKQQITPETLAELIEQLILREGKEDDLSAQSELEYLRQEINQIDDEILNLLSNRMKVAQEIGAYKKKNNITILQLKRWQEIILKSRAYAKNNGLSEDFIFSYLRSLHDESINQQAKIMKK